MRRIFLFSLAFTILIIPIGWSDIPQTISYQGFLTDSSGSPVSDGFYELTFRIYEPETGPSEWSETHSLVEVKGGVFSVLASTLPDEFSVRCTGGARFVSSIDDSGDPVTGVKLESDGTGWSNICDRSVKENFARVDAESILQSLMSVPIETWNAKGQDPSIRHIGPMAQDFYRAFGLGEDNRYICTVDADGVALAAIQGLYELLRERDERISELEVRMRKLGERIASL